MVSHIKSVLKANDERMMSYLKMVKHLAAQFSEFEIVQVSRIENGVADSLANLASSFPPITGQISPKLLSQSLVSFSLIN